MTQQFGEVARSLDYVTRNARRRLDRNITVDDREPLDGLTETFLRGLGYTITRHTLPLGDYQWDSKLGLVVVERKTQADIMDYPRLYRQVTKLREARKTAGVFPILLLDENFRYGAKNIDNILLSVQGRIRVVYCATGGLAQKLDDLYQYSNAAQHELLDTEV